MATPELHTLTQEQLEEFKTHGVLVIPNILSQDELVEARQGLHATLARYGCDVTNLEETADKLATLSTTGGSGGILDIFYPQWKLKVCQHPALFGAMRDLWTCTFGANLPEFSHPYAKDIESEGGYIYMDRVCFRVPETVSKIFAAGDKKKLQRSLTPHLDCCPHDLLVSASSKEFPKWRPIQSLVTLTDTLVPNHGGFECVPGFHLEFDEWAKRRSAEAKPGNKPPCVGDFTPIRVVEDADVLRRFTHIPVPAGAALIWDNRIPHANSRTNDGEIARECVYAGFLPPTEQNRNYVQEQLRRYKKWIIPQDMWIGSERLEEQDPADLENPEAVWTDLGKKLMGVEAWSHSIETQQEDVSFGFWGRLMHGFGVKRST